MKNLRLISAVLFFLTAFNFSSCTTDLEPVDPAIVIPNPTDPTDPTGPTDPGAPASFKADIDGAHFTANTTIVYISGGSIIINAVRAQGDSFAFLLHGTTTGTYPANSDVNLIGYNPSDDSNTYVGVPFDNGTQDTGSVIVSTIDTVHHTISGTFQFTGYTQDDLGNSLTKQFTNGVFTNLPYVTDNPTGDTFFAKVNGSEFVDTDILTGSASAGGATLITVSAENAAGDSISVNMDETLGVGTYQVSNGEVQINYTPAGEDFGEFATGGTVTITEKSATHIKGMFQTTIVVNSVTYVITEGAFDVAL